MMLSFQVSNACKVIQIDCDCEGLEKLLALLQKLKNEKSGHIHLSTPSGGGFLNEKTPWGENAVNEVVISLGGDK